MDKTVMEYDSTQISFQKKIEEEYNEAVKNGFVGTIEEYKALRDYT